MLGLRSARVERAIDGWIDLTAEEEAALSHQARGVLDCAKKRENQPAKAKSDVEDLGTI
jgi:hypothetical protein